MFKKIHSLFIVLCLSIFMSGCIKSSTQLELTKKDELIIDQYAGIKFGLLKMMNPNFDSNNPAEEFEKMNPNALKEINEQCKTKGCRAENYKDNDSVGIKVSKTLKKIDFLKEEVILSGVTGIDGNYLIEIKRGSFKTSYSIGLRFDPKKAEEQNQKLYNKNNGNQAENQLEYGENQIEPEGTLNNSSQPDNMMKMFASQMMNNPALAPTVEFKIKIPNNMKVTKHNATKEDSANFEYTWDLASMPQYQEKQPIDIILEFYKVNYFNIIFLIIIVLATLIAVSKSGKYSKDTDETKNAY